MDGAGRRRQIVEAISEREEVQVAAMVVALGCSEMTVRRDLEALEREGVLRRVHGGATRALQTAEETPYAMRELDRPLMFWGSFRDRPSQQRGASTSKSATNAGTSNWL